MSDILEEVNASGGDVAYIRTLELVCDAWPASKYVCTGYKDQLLGTEDGRILTFQAINLAISLPVKDNKGAQTLNFATDNTTGDVSQLVDLALSNDTRVTAIYRTYLSTNKTAPAERPYRMVVLAGDLEGVIANLQCGFFNILLNAWPRRYLTTDYAPGLRYL